MSTFDELVVLKHGAFDTDGQPHPDARRVWGINVGRTGSKQAGWLMPQIADVHPKTARWQRHMARYAR